MEFPDWVQVKEHFIAMKIFRLNWNLKLQLHDAIVNPTV